MDPARRRRLVGLLLVLAAAASFGLMALFARLAYAAGMNPPSLLALRFIIAGVCIALMVRWRGERMPRGRALGGLVAMGTVFYALVAQAYFVALLHASAALVALVLYTFPVLVMAANIAFFGERATGRKLLVALLTMLGLATTIGGELRGEWLGIGLALAGAFGYAAYIIVGDRLAQGVPPLPGGLVVILGCAFTSAVFALAAGVRLPQTALGWAAVCGIALLSTVFAIAAFLEGLNRVGSTTAAMASTLEPVVTVLSAAALLGEPLSASTVGGGLLIVTAVILLARTPHPSQGVVT